ncbi:hypothetical protein BJY00DRAFT_112392 [Aspergillus carlsbadensis]|nr:hypothetical protein BJY00DRAFT_112392 [Aspergillus carlsbadensis]
MRLPRLQPPPHLLLLLLLSYASLLPSVTATDLIETNALDIIKPGNFSASLFSAVFTPNNRTASLRLVGDTKITGNVTAEIHLLAYGYQATNESLNPCRVKALTGFCPMQAGPLELTMSNIPIANKTLGMIPGITYSIPDLDAIVRISVKSLKTGEETTVVQAVLSNGKTVYQAAVGWIVAVFAGIALVVSVVVPIIWGYSDAAVRLAGYTFSLFGFVQSQAMLGMLAVPLPPIAQSWTQNFQWSMGVVHADFLGKVCTWYQRSTGGTADQLMETMSTHMVHVLRRRDETTALSPATALTKRADAETSSSTDVVVRGLSRVAFRAGIEQSNLFLTAIIIFAFITFIVVILLSLWKAVQLHPRLRSPLPYWNSMSKGILHRIYFLAFAPICIFCLWELTQRDSAAEIVLAILTFLFVVGALLWAAVRVLLIRSRALGLGRQPGPALFSDPAILHKYGFLFVHYNRNASYFSAVLLGSIFLKALFISFAQSSPKAQAIAFLIFDLAMLIAVCILRPYLDKKTNAVGITVASITFLHSLFALFFSNIFNQHRMVASVMGVVLFVTSAAMIMVLLGFMLWYCVKTGLAVRSREKPYRPMSETSEAGVGLRSSSGLVAGDAERELDDLAAAARGEGKRRGSIL